VYCYAQVQKEIQDIPSNWKMGIKKGGTQFKTYKQNYGEGRTCIVYIMAKKYLVLLGRHP
jgi:hypothetical protein